MFGAPHGGSSCPALSGPEPSRSAWPRSGQGAVRERVGSGTVNTPQDTSSTSGRTDRDLDDAVLAALFSEAQVGLHVLDTELRLVRYNSAARNIRAFPLEEFLGRRLIDVLRVLTSRRRTPLRTWSAGCWTPAGRFAMWW
ncbi:PAS domain-containing protein [Streptomyces sp. NPDC048357]|uniref:PAS domain-containing protein n=1 Tax=Streptomyces sp. NPDC048357 TaxID=3154719 RepID=UPI00342278CB